MNEKWMYGWGMDGQMGGWMERDTWIDGQGMDGSISQQIKQETAEKKTKKFITN